MPHHRKKRTTTPATTRRLETPALEGRDPLPEELTGRASGTGEDLAALFDDQSMEHLRDGFRGGSDDDVETDVQKVDRASRALGEAGAADAAGEDEEVPS